MSKTIECASIHIGEINLTTKNDEQRTVVFENKDGVGIAMLDEDEAAVLLGGIGRPDYWKPGTTGDAVADALANDPIAAAAAAKLLSGEAADDEAAGRLTLKDLYELIAAAETAEEVDKLVEGDTRKGAIKAADERKKELAE